MSPLHTLLLTGAGALALGLLILAIQGTASPIGTVSLLLGAGLAVLGWVGYFTLRDRVDRLGSTTRRSLRGWMIALLVGLGGLAVLLVAAWMHLGAVERACEGATREHVTAQERALDHEESQRLRQGSWHELVRRLDDDFEPACTQADEEQRRRAAGRCSLRLPLDAPCRCGHRRWPDERPCRGPARCRRPEGKEMLVCEGEAPRPEPVDLDEAARSLDELAHELQLDLPPIRRRE